MLPENVTPLIHSGAKRHPSLTCGNSETSPLGKRHLDQGGDVGGDVTPFWSFSRSEGGDVRGDIGVTLEGDTVRHPHQGQPPRVGLGVTPVREIKNEVHDGSWILLATGTVDGS